MKIRLTIGLLLLGAFSAARAQQVVAVPGVTAPPRPISGVDCDPATFSRPTATSTG